MIWRPSVCQSASAYRIVPVPSVAMNESDLRDFDEEPVEQADQRSAGDDDQNGNRPRDAELDLQADRQDMPHDDAEADGEVDTACHHRQCRRQRQQRDDCLVAEDRARVERGRERVRQKQREKDNQQDRQDRQAIDWRQTSDRSPAR